MTDYVDCDYECAVNVTDPLLELILHYFEKQRLLSCKTIAGRRYANLCFDAAQVPHLFLCLLTILSASSWLACFQRDRFID